MKITLQNGGVFQGRDDDHAMEQYVDYHYVRGLKPGKIRSIKDSNGYVYSGEEIEGVYDEAVDEVEDRKREDEQKDAEYWSDEDVRMASEEAASILGLYRI